MSGTGISAECLARTVIHWNLEFGSEHWDCLETQSKTEKELENYMAQPRSSVVPTMNICLLPQLTAAGRESNLIKWENYSKMYTLPFQQSATCLSDMIIRPMLMKDFSVTAV